MEETVHKIYVLLLDSTPTNDKSSICAGGALSWGPNRWKIAINYYYYYYFYFYSQAAKSSQHRSLLTLRAL